MLRKRKEIVCQEDSVKCPYKGNKQRCMNLNEGKCSIRIEGRVCIKNGLLGNKVLKRIRGVQFMFRFMFGFRVVGVDQRLTYIL